MSPNLFFNLPRVIKAVPPVVLEVGEVLRFRWFRLSWVHSLTVPAFSPKLIAGIKLHEPFSQNKGQRGGNGELKHRRKSRTVNFVVKIGNCWRSRDVGQTKGIPLKSERFRSPHHPENKTFNNVFVLHLIVLIFPQSLTSWLTIPFVNKLPGYRVAV